MNRLFVFKSLLYLFSVVLLTGFAGYLAFAWNQPVSTDPSHPEFNPAAPLNVSTTPQAKFGRLSAVEFYHYDGEFYLKDSAGNMRLSKNDITNVSLSFGSSIKNLVGTVTIYDSAGTYTDVYNPDTGETVGTVTGVIPIDLID